MDEQKTETKKRRKQYNIHRDFDYITRVDYNCVTDPRSLIGRVAGDPLPGHILARNERNAET